MRELRSRRLLTIAFGGLFLFLDQSFKWLSLNVWARPRLPLGFIGWQPFANPGAAFGIALPVWSILAISAAIISLIVFFASQEHRRERTWPFVGWAILLSGALSNFIDRLVYNSVIDYFLVGVSLINLADVMIVGGLGIVIMDAWRKAAKIN